MRSWLGEVHLAANTGEDRGGNSHQKLQLGDLLDCEVLLMKNFFGYAMTPDMDFRVTADNVRNKEDMTVSGQQTRALGFIPKSQV